MSGAKTWLSAGWYGGSHRLPIGGGVLPDGVPRWVVK